MKRMSRKLPIQLLLLTVAGFINAIGVTAFLSPVGLLDGGFSGTSVFISSLLNAQIWPFLLALNLPFFLFAYKRLGRRFVLTSIYAVGIYALGTFLIQTFMDVSISSPIAGTDLLLCAVFGGLLSGIGSGMTIHLGGALDGVEILAVIFSKGLGLTVGTFVMLYNCVIFILSGIVSGLWALPLYSIIAYAVGIKTIDFIVEGLDKAKAALVITEHKDAVAQACSDTFGYGITVINASGFYSNRDKAVLYIVVNRFEIPTLNRLIEETDPAAFITIIDISDVMGSGLRGSKKPQGGNTKKAVPAAVIEAAAAPVPSPETEAAAPTVETETEAVGDTQAAEPTEVAAE